VLEAVTPTSQAGPFAPGFLDPDLEMLDDKSGPQMPTAIPATDELLVILAYFLARLR
jgi:hypothetical protein